VLPDIFLGVSDAGLLTSAAHQLKQRYEVELSAARRSRKSLVGVAWLAISRRHPVTEQLAQHIRAVVPILAVAGELEAEAKVLRALR
jgi:hypothetical protein